MKRLRRLLKKAKILVQRRRNAKKIGVKFTRAAAWKLPEKILINKSFIDLDLTNDGSTSTSFIDIFLDDVYGLQFFKSCLPEVKKIVDIGANQGLFTLAAGNIFSAEIHSYEPNPQVIKQLKYHSDIVDATCFNEAVGLVNGYINVETGKDSLHGKARLSDTGSISQVSFETVISRMNGDIDILKLDCEGAEWEILKDVNSLKQVRAITMEYHLEDKHDHESIKKVLKNAGFKAVHHEIAGESWGMVYAMKAIT